MNSKWIQSSEVLSPEKLERLEKRHLRGARVRSIASISMWLLAILGFLLGLFKTHHFVGVSASVLFLILMNPPTLFILKKLTRKKSYEYFSLFINQIEIIVYTSVIYFCGGIEAVHLTLVYAALIAYVGVVAPQGHSFIVASLCVITFSLMIGLVYFGYLPYLAIMPGNIISNTYQLLTLLVVIGLLYMVAYISAATSSLLRRHRDKLHEHNIEMAKTNEKLLQEIKERIQMEKEKNRLQAQLQRAQKMEAIGALAGGVAHDLNNILSGIVSYPDLLLMQRPEDSPFRKSILIIQETGNKAAAIVQDLLTLARRGVAITEILNLNDIISEYLKSPEYKKLISYHLNIDVETNLDTSLLNIFGSSIHLTKTMMNLVSNAAEAMPDRGKLIISTENRYLDRPIKGYDTVEEGDYIVLTVSDTGIGIAPDDLDRIFEPFYTKKEMGRSGTGLGMAVVWGTVKDHKGYIDLQSTEGKGTTFTLYFPTTRKQLSEKHEALSVESFKGDGESILVVDDVKAQREIASEILSELGYSVVTVSSGESAVEYLKTSSVDLVVLDMIMDPGMDGLDTYRKIIDLHPGQKAIIASGFSETDRVKKAQRLGATQYIKKPYTLGNIGMAIKKELSK